MASSGSWFDETFGPGAERPDDFGADDRPTTEFARPEGLFDQRGNEPTAPLFMVGAVPAPYRLPDTPGPSYDHLSWPPPTEPVPAPPVLAPPVQAAAIPMRAPRRSPRAGTVVAIAALTALLVGGAAGYGGTRLAAWQAAGGGASGTVPGATGPATAASPTSTTSSTVAIARKVLPSTVTIRVSGGSGGDNGGTGSGLILDTSGRILTNNHVVEAAGDGGRLQVVYADGTTVIGELIGRSPSYDLAVVQVTPTAALVPVQLGNSDQTQVGETAIAVGSPLGLGGTVTEGIISAKDRPVAVNESSDTDAPSAYIDALQTDAPINPGNSGGPLVDSAGQVIGVNSAILTLGSSQTQNGSIGLGFAIPINQAMQIARELIRDGHATYPVIGAGAVDAGSTAGSSDGVLLQNVQPGQPAAQAGLEDGDVVTAIDGRTVSQAEELIVAIRGHRPGDTVTLSYQRGGLAQQARVTLGSKEG